MAEQARAHRFQVEAYSHLHPQTLIVPHTFCMFSDTAPYYMYVVYTVTLLFEWPNVHKRTAQKRADYLKPVRYHLLVGLHL